jgi:hypothetical protein
MAAMPYSIGVTDTRKRVIMTHKEYAESLRMIADWFEAHPDVKLPHDHKEFRYFMAQSREAMAHMAKVMGSCEKRYNDAAGQFELSKDFGKIEFRAICSRSQVCNRKVVGHRQVPETIIPARTEDIVEWECFETPLLATAVPALPEAE